MQRSFKDLFSHASADYQRYRPHYPEALFDQLRRECLGQGLAWDCACGTGQAASRLSEHFRLVVATDASTKQIEQAQHTQRAQIDECAGSVETASAARVQFRIANAEASGLADGSVDLITVAQALHWFDRPRFYREAERVLRAGGLLAVWCYSLARSDPPLDAIVDHLYHDIVGPYWPAERRWVETGYRDIDFPFAELEFGPFQMSSEWRLEQLLGYLATWSAVRRFREAIGEDPIAQIAPELAAAWGDAARPRRFTWPLHLRVGRSSL